MKAIKTLAGIFIVLLLLTSATVLILSIWGIYILSWAMICKIALSGVIVGVLILFLWIIKHLFFKKGI